MSRLEEEKSFSVVQSNEKEMEFQIFSLIL